MQSTDKLPPRQIRKLTHARFREKAQASMYDDIHGVLKCLHQARLRKGVVVWGGEEAAVPATHKERVLMLEFRHYAVRTFADSIRLLCGLRVQELYAALERVGRAPGSGIAHRYVKGFLDPALAKDAWAVDIGAVNGRDVHKIDLIYGCLLLLFPELVSCLVDDEFVALVSTCLPSGDATVSHLASVMRRRMCRKLDALYLTTDGRNTWTAEQHKVGPGGRKRQGLLAGALVVGLQQDRLVRWFRAGYASRLHARVQGLSLSSFSPLSPRAYACRSPLRAVVIDAFGSRCQMK